MKKVLLLLLLATSLATSAFADDTVREIFPSDYTPSPCAADPASICESFPVSRISAGAALYRGFQLRQDWAYAHWDEMMAAFRPFCTKVASCFTIKDNDWVYCLDLARQDFLDTCNRFPEGSDDRDQCRMFAVTYYIGLGGKSQQHAKAQECSTNAADSVTRKLKAWIEPQTYDLKYNGPLTIYAYDAETHIPVRARMAIDGGKLQYTEGPFNTSGYPSIWTAGLARVLTPDGHRQFIPPTATLTATGYEPLTLPIVIDAPKLLVEMSPSADQLKPGINTINVTTRDAATGKPVEMRVMAGDLVLGNANAPLTIELKRGQKRPEIWVTSLYDHYSDYVIAKAK
jgi:opacity protein-like surface antigen